ncbi:hypothetical protein FGG08_002045 [Glutinoglossum americanum]|uniref:Uncharacterized protein n=1 Tax=Glutinoglossum americanum TaxID=1670608 RepID=A0A9P8I5F2_9PEZI|nr:hypothetical protein FGG08_002045 [Glutinoglossum americanum]
MSSHASLEAQANDRKARLAQLKSLKRKQTEEHDRTINDSTDVDRDTTPDVTSLHLSGRNYDPTTRGPKLGFMAPPSANTDTLETLASTIITSALEQQQEEEAQPDKAIDLFKLQPKKPNWDLKRDVERKVERLNVRTENAIAMLVRERVRKAQENAGGKGSGAQEGEAVGMDGVSLVEGVHLREREEEDERREREDDEDMV